MPKNPEKDWAPKGKEEFVAWNQRRFEQIAFEQLVTENLIERTVPVQKGDTHQELIMGGDHQSLLPITSITQEMDWKTARETIAKLEDFYGQEVAFHQTTIGTEKKPIASFWIAYNPQKTDPGKPAFKARLLRDIINYYTDSASLLE